MKKLLLLLLIIPPLLGGSVAYAQEPDPNCPISEIDIEKSLSLEYVLECGICIPIAVSPTEVVGDLSVTPLPTPDMSYYMTQWAEWGTPWPNPIESTPVPQSTQVPPQPTASSPEYYVDDSQASGNFTIVYTPVGGWSSTSYFNHSVTCSDGDLLGIIFRNQLEAGTYFGNSQYWQPFSNVGQINTKAEDLIFVENGQNNSNITSQAEAILGITFDLGIGSGLWFSGDTYSWSSKSQYYGNSSGSYTVNTLGGLCYGIPPVPPVPTPIPPVSTIPVSCSEWDYSDDYIESETGVLDYTDMQILAGECFTFITGMNIEIPFTEDSWGWPNIEFCPMLVTPPDIAILGIVVPDLFLALPFVLLFFGLIARI